MWESFFENLKFWNNFEKFFEFVKFQDYLAQTTHVCGSGIFME